LALDLNAGEIANRITEAARVSGKSEEQLKIKITDMLADYFREIVIDKARYEKAVKLSSGETRRSDFLFGGLIMEYEAANRCTGPTGGPRYKHAMNQAEELIEAEAGTKDERERFFGIVLDGQRIGFVKYRRGQWIETAPQPINAVTVTKLIEAIRGLERKSLDVALLVLDLGARSNLAQRLVPLLYKKLLSMKSRRTEVLFKDWRRVFTQVCSYSEDKLKGLEDDYGIHKSRVNASLLLFAVHSYYVLAMKLLVAEVALLYRGGILVRSYLAQLSAAYALSKEKLRLELAELEHEGGIFSKEAELTNFLEGDYFSWYIDEWDDDVADAVHSLIDCLSKYEPGTAELEPERVTDLFKNLYQNLVNEDIRYALGEHYTPDWLAHLTLDEANFTVDALEEICQKSNDPLAPLSLRILDPACGSGTFLVQVISRLREYANNHFLQKTPVLTKILDNVVGFDLNPLAVMASRANFLIALGELLREPPEGGVTLPVYLADSILVERRTILSSDGKRDVYVIPTEVADFALPTNVVEAGKFERILTLLEDCVSNYSHSEFTARLNREFPEISTVDVKVLVELFRTLTKLESEDTNKIWLRLLKNSCAPLLKGKFNFVVGNPPWVGWGELPEKYRERMRPIWERVGLISSKLRPTRTGSATAMGKVRKELATLFIAVSLERYLPEDIQNESNTIAFLLPFTTFKAPAEGEFRTMLANKTKVVQVHDLVTLRPFKRATNRTAMIVLSKVAPDQIKREPIPVSVWKLKKHVSTDPLDSIVQVKSKSNRKSMVFVPIQRNNFASPWMELSRNTVPVLSRVLGRSEYTASAGVFTGINGVYFTEIIQKRPKSALLRNRATEGAVDKAGKGRVEENSGEVEAEYIFPMARGRDLAAWECKPSGYILLPIDVNGRTISSSELKVKGPGCFKFLDKFYEALINRKALPYGPKLAPYRKYHHDRRRAEGLAGVPPYWVFNAATALTPWKVAWKDVSGAITGKGVLEACVIGPASDEQVGRKVIVPEHVVMFISTPSEDEAHYLAAVLNSCVVKLVVASYTMERHIGSHLTRYIRIPKFDPSLRAHQELARCSKQAHSEPDKRQVIEKEIDKWIADRSVFDISEKELEQVRDDLETLLG
jgi:SAM-dependent methyltransferase